MKLLAVLAILLCISVGYDGLKCYRCVSTKSWDDCASVKKEVNCSADENRCSKAFVSGKEDGVSVKGYEKGCVSAADCDAFPKTDFCKEKECKIDCCTGDLCNAAAVPMISAVVITACPFVVFAF